MQEQSQQSREQFIQGRLNPDVIPGFLHFWLADRPDPTQLAVSVVMQGWTIAWGFEDGCADSTNLFPKDSDYDLGYRLGQEYVSGQPL